MSGVVSRSAESATPSDPPAEPAAPTRRRRDRLFPGDRRIWLTAATLLAIGLLVITVELLIPREYYTGTNSVRTRGFVTLLKAGDRLCVPGLNVPADTSRVQMQAAIDVGPLPDQTATLNVGGHTYGPVTVRGTGKVPFNDNKKIDFTFPTRPSSPASSTGTICVRSAGKVFYGGMSYLAGTDPSPTINGRPSRNRVAIWYLPKAGEKRSRAAQLPAVIDRAALFRPGFVGPWTYVVLLFLVLPLLGYGGVRVMAVAAQRSPRRLAATVALIAFANAATWALISPSFLAPDESEHFAYVQHFGETGKRVSQSADPSRFVYSDQESFAVDTIHLFSMTEQPDGRPPWLKADEQRLAARTAAAHHRPSQSNGGGNTAATQAHSPAYYATVSPGYLVTKNESIWSQLFAVRLLSALLGSIVAACAFAIVRELIPRSPEVAVSAGLLVAFQPMFAFISGSVNNDNGVNAFAAICIYLTIRTLKRGFTVRTGLALGLSLIVMPLMKATGYELYPVIGLALLVALWRHHDRAALRGVAALGGAFVAAAVAWKLAAPSFVQSIPPVTGVATGAPAKASTTALTGALDNLPGYGSYLWQVFLPKLPFMTDLWIARWPFYEIYIQRGFASFGWYQVLFPTWVYGAVLAVLGFVGLSGLTALARFRAFTRRHWAEIALLILAPITVIGAVEAAYYVNTPRAITAEFGRYAFPAISAVAALAAGSAFAFGRRRAPQVAAGLVAAMIVLSVASQLLTLATFYT